MLNRQLHARFSASAENHVCSWGICRETVAPAFLPVKAECDSAFHHRCRGPYRLGAIPVHGPESFFGRLGTEQADERARVEMCDRFLPGHTHAATRSRKSSVTCNPRGRRTSLGENSIQPEYPMRFGRPRWRGVIHGLFVPAHGLVRLVIGGQALRLPWVSLAGGAVRAGLAFALQQFSSPRQGKRHLAQDPARAA